MRLVMYKFMFKESIWSGFFNSKKQIILKALFVSVFLLIFFGLAVGQANAVSLPTVDNNVNTKLLEVGGVYYYSFTSSTNDGTHHLFVATSTNGVADNWSLPVDMFQYGIFSSQGNDTTYPVRSFGFDYNSVGGYFGAAIYATGTSEIWFASSTDGVNWSTSTAVSGMSTSSITRRLFLNFSKLENFVTIFFQSNNGGDDLLNVVSSANNGQSWVAGETLSVGNTAGQVLSGAKVSGSGSARVFQFGYFSQNNFKVIYASSTNGGIWTTTTIASNVNYVAPGPTDINFSHLVSFDVDSDGLPAFSYYQPLIVGGSYGTTSTIIYARKSNAGT